MDPNAWRLLDRRVETAQFGPFTFQIGVDPNAVALSLQRVEDAHQRFIAAPLSQVANQLEREVVASSVFGTNTIEGGTLTEEETATALTLAPEAIRDVERRRVANIKAAYDRALRAASVPNWQLDLDFIREIHAAITQGLPHPQNQQGAFLRMEIDYIGILWTPAARLALAVVLGFGCSIEVLECEAWIKL